MLDREVYGYTIFCDDVRQEINAKVSLIGVLPPVISVHGPFPFQAQKLCMAVYFYEAHKLALAREHEVPLVVFGPGQTIDNPAMSAIVPRAPKEILEEALKGPMYISDETLYSIAITILWASPFLIQEPGWVRVRAIYGDEIIKLGSLRFDQGPIQTQT
jgi:hypothetical protein